MSYRQLWPLALIAAAPLWGQPSVDEILGKYAQAIGGRAACEKITTRTMTGTVEIPDDNVTGKVVVLAKAPGSYRLTMDIPGYGVVEMVLDGASGWQRNPDTGTHSMNKKDLQIAARDHDFYHDLRLKELYAGLQVAGADKLDGRDVYILEGAAPDGPNEKFYFDAASGLLLKHDFERVTLEDGIVQYEMLYADYRDVDGVKLPSRVEQRAPDNTMIFKFTEIKNNAPLGEGAFSAPEK